MTVYVVTVSYRTEEFDIDHENMFDSVHMTKSDALKRRDEILRGEKLNDAMQDVFDRYNDVKNFITSESMRDIYHYIFCFFEPNVLECEI